MDDTNPVKNYRANKSETPRLNNIAFDGKSLLTCLQPPNLTKKHGIPKQKLEQLH